MMLRCSTKNSGRFFLLPFRNRTCDISGFYRNNALDKIAETEVDTPQHEKQKSQ